MTVPAGRDISSVYSGKLRQIDKEGGRNHVRDSGIE